MSQSSTPRPTERNWADLMDDLLNENFTAQGRPKAAVERTGSKSQSRAQPAMEQLRAPNSKPAAQK